MDIDKIKRLLGAFFDATADASQEAELKRLLASCDFSALPLELATDARLARSLLGMGAPAPAMPADFAATLGRQVDRLDRVGRMKRRGRGWGIVAGVAVAASLALLLMPSGSVQTVIAPSAQAPVMARAMLPAPSAGTAQAVPTRQLAQAVSPKSAAPKADKAVKAEAEDGDGPERTVEYVDGVLVVTEYYDPNNASKLTATADIPVDAPIYISYVDGEGQTYQSLDQSPDAMAMLEEAFGLIVGTQREADGALDESRKLVTSAIEELNENR